MDVKVYLWGSKVGTLRYNEKACISSFQYDLDFIKLGVQVSPIVMPLSNKTYQFNKRIDSNFGLPPMLRDSIPDIYGNQMINIYLKSLGRSEKNLTPSERLCYAGKRGMGALEYKPSTEVANLDSNINISSLTKLASDVLNQREKFKTKDIAELINISTSAGGMRAKAVVQYNPKTKEFRTGQLTHHKGFVFAIVKFDEFNSNNEYTRIEYAYYLTAKEAGINIMNSFLLFIDNKYHFVTERFDRIIRKNKIDKFHVQTLSAMCNVDYNEPNSTSYETAFETLDKIGASNDKEELFRRMIFNIIMRNQDDHPKNISFLMKRDGTWHLSPAYDLTYAYDSNNKWLKAHQMNINGKVNNFLIKDIYQIANKFNIKKRKAIEIISQVEKAAGKFVKFAKQAYVSEERAKEMINNFYHLK